ALRYALANAEAFNPWNDGERHSFDKLFQDRRFSSWITKESNVYDRRIVDCTQGIDALMESERVKDSIFEFEHDLWNF
ncbi:MAG TPA: gliding motility protein GldN, partial [Flavobacteriales bacterium]|nr:gliding motility protein GldN [Flavobacteriales bacterium]